MFEYVLKFVPEIIDHGIKAIFDFNGLGDPRPRLFDNLLIWLTVEGRAWLFRYLTVPPSLSINWLIHPICLVSLYAAVVRLSGGSTRSGIMSAVIYASSPALLESIADLFLPAKALTNFCLAIALYGATWLTAVEGMQTRAKPVYASILIGAAILISLLADETGAFIAICVPLISISTLYKRGITSSAAFAAALAILISFATFALLTFIAFPAVNTALDQAPIGFTGTVDNSTFATMFGGVQTSILSKLASASPFSLFQTLVSAHTVPFRIVEGIWTSTLPPRLAWQWSFHEQATLGVAALIFAWGIYNLEEQQRSLAISILASFGAFIAGEAILITWLAPYLTEANYYGAMSSVFFAIFSGIIFGSNRSTTPILNWIFIAYFASAQFGNFYATAARHPYLGKARFDWKSLSSMRKEILENGPDILRGQELPSRSFFYGFEIAAAIGRQHNERADLMPLSMNPSSLYNYFGLLGRPPDFTDIEDPMLNSAPLDRADATKSLYGKNVRGRIGNWEFQLKFGNEGQVEARAWRFDLSRLFGDHGMVEWRNAYCIKFHHWNDVCFDRLYQKEEDFFVYTTEGKLIAQFSYGGSELR